MYFSLGKLVEKRYFEEDFKEVCTVAMEQHLSWYECEKELFQINHATIGKTIFRSWNFPPTVVDAVQFHHNPSSSTKAPQLTALVHVADLMSYKIDYGAPGAWAPKECDPDALKMLGLTMEQAEQLCQKVESEMDGAMEILKLLE